MKKFKIIWSPLVCFLAVGLGAAAPAELPATSSNDAARLILNIRSATLETVLHYLSEAAGYVIQLKPGVELSGTVDVWSDQPLNRDEALALVKQVLGENGYTAVVNDRILTIMRSGDAPKAAIPVRLGNDPAKIPRTPDIVTQIMPVRTLNPVEMKKILTPLLPAGVVLDTDESANALVLTAAQSDIHRVAEIVAALDSVSSSANSLHVFPLHYADAKTLAGLIKELFSAPDTTSRTGNAGGRGNTIRFTGIAGLPGANAGAGADASGQTPISRVAAVADEHGNAVIVSAPEGMIPAIENLVDSLDVSVDDITAIEVYPLKNADPAEMAEVLSNLFPDQTEGTDAGASQFLFGGLGGRGGQTGGARQGATGVNNSPSGRLQKLGRVLAVPDRRTSAVIVTAARSLLPGIEEIIASLDAIDAGKQKVHVVELRYADPSGLVRILGDIYPSSTVSSSTATRTDPLEDRARNVQNNQMTSGPGSGVSSGFGGSSTGSRGSFN